MNNERPIPFYAVHKDGIIAGFFGPFSFLSNFYVLENGVFLDNLCFPSTEAAYQAAKYPFNQRAQFIEITAGKAKKLGKIAPEFNANKWNKKKYDIMYELNWQKYNNNPILQEKLVMTDGCHLEERNNWSDRFWGTDVDGVGENNLGKILMRIRDKILSLRRGDSF